MQTISSLKKDGVARPSYVRLFSLFVALLVGLLFMAVHKVRNLQDELQNQKNFKTEYIKQHTSGLDTHFIAALKPQDVHVLINNQRKKAGVAELKYDARLEQTACQKADDMIKYDYWAHISPQGVSPWLFFTNNGVYYSKAGENLAYGFANGEELTKGWMKSPGHRVNILNAEFTAEGLCFKVAEKFQGMPKQTVVVQHFMKEL